MLLRRDVYGIVSNILYGRAGEEVRIFKSSPRVAGGEIHIVEGRYGRFVAVDEDLALQQSEVDTDPVIRIIQQVPARKQKKKAVAPPILNNQQSIF